MKNLKGIAVILSIALLAVGITACGGQDTSSDPGSGTETGKQEEKRDALAETRYRLTEEEYDDDSMIPEHKLTDEYLFANDGTFERSYQTMSVILVDNGLEPKWNDVKETGTYTIDGDKVTITGSDTGEKEMTLEDGKLVWNSEENDITGNTLKVKRVYSK